jgi:sortase A
MRRKIGLLLIIAGISIVLVTLYINWDVRMKQKAMMEEFDKAVEGYQDDAGEQDQEPQDSDEGSSSENGSFYNVKGTLAILTIPKIGLKVAVVDGVDNKSLKYAVGHFKGTAMPGESGNCAIAGHRSYTYNKFFNRLGEIKIGDEFYMKTKAGEQRYVVFEVKIIEPSDTSVLKDTKDTIVTLITCHPPRIANKRLVIKGRLQQ